MMLSFKLQFKVLEITDEVIDINGFDYKKIRALVPGYVSIDCYILVSHMKKITTDYYYLTPKAYITSFDWTKNRSKEISIRIDSVHSSSKVSYEEERDTTVRVNGRISRSENNEFKYRGPMKIPVFSTTLVIKNEFSDVFFVLLIGLNNRAKQLFELPNFCYVDITGTLSRRNPNRPCAILISSIEIRKEVTL